MALEALTPIDPREIQRTHVRIFSMPKLVSGLLINGDFTIAIKASTPLSTTVRIATRNSIPVVTDKHVKRGLRPMPVDADLNKERIALIDLLRDRPKISAIYTGENYEYKLRIVERDNDGARVQIESSKPFEEPIPTAFEEPFFDALAKHNPQP